MSVPFGTIAYGGEDLRLSPVTGASNTVGTAVDVVGFRAFNFNVESDTNTLDGDNRRIAIARGVKTLTGDMEWGQMILEALAVVNGGTVEITGVTPDQIKTLDESDTVAVRWFQAEFAAPSMDVAGSEYQALLPKLMATSGPDESHTVNDWSTPTISFEGVSVGGVLVTRMQYETAVGLGA